MSYTILVTNAFLNDLLSLPRQISRSVPGKVKILEQDPASANGDAKKLHNLSAKVYRVRVRDNYRLVYLVGKGTVKLCGIGHRSKIYKNLHIPQASIPLEDQEVEDMPEIIEVEEEEEEANKVDYYQYSEKPNSLGISENLLKQVRIPTEYWEILNSIEDEDELLMAQVPHDALTRLIERLYPRSINEILDQPEYVLEDVEYLNQYFEGDAFDPLLRLDAEQERLLELEVDEPILVRGGPGTGKSIMAVYHIKRLIDQGLSSILLATHSSSFSAYAKQLLNRLLGQPIDKFGIEIRTVESLVSEYFLQHIESPNHPNRETEIELLKEAISICKSHVPANVRELHWNISHDKVKKLGYDYVLEEINDVIESCCLTKKEYLKLDRRGRGVSVGLRERTFLWEVTQKWHSLLREKTYFPRGLTASKVLDLASKNSHKKYQYLIIDEAQDISPVNFRFLLELVASKNNIYVTADEAQAIYRRGFSWRLIYEILNSKKILNLNYNFRNTEQISAACSIILENANDNPAKGHGELPIVIEFDDLQQEVKVIKDFFINSAKQNHIPLSAAAILCPNQQLAFEYARLMNNESLAAEYVRGGEIDIDKPFIKVLTLFDAKGLEFPIVAIAGIRSDTFPGDLSHIPADEREMFLSQQKRMLYVGCSRAMKALLVTRSAEYPSEFTDLLREPLWEQRRAN